jgi:hypothetical protein
VKAALIRIFVILTGLGPALSSLAANPMDLELNGWCADNAVIPMGEHLLGEIRGDEWLSGFARYPGVRSLRVIVSLDPDRVLEPTFSRPTKDKPDRVAWKLETGSDSRRALKSAFAGATFELSFTSEARGQRASVLRTVTNLAVGPVWVMVVDPNRDSIDLPPITEKVRDRIRILPLMGAGAMSSARWVTAREAEKMSIFCGVPRAFANELAGKVGDHGGAIGLVLCTYRLAVNELSPGRALSGWQSQGREGTPALRSAVAAAYEADVGLVSSADARNFRAGIAHTNELLDLKREGLVGEAFVPPIPRLGWVHPGGQPGLPMAVSGLFR